MKTTLLANIDWNSVRKAALKNQQVYVKVNVLSKQIGVSSELITQWKQAEFLIEDVHYVQFNHRLVLYCLPLILDRIANFQDDEAHERALHWYFREFLPSGDIHPEPTWPLAQASVLASAQSQAQQVVGGAA